MIGDGLLDSFLFRLDGIPAFMIATLVAGFISPGAFWLWGVAAALPVPFVDAILTRQLIVRGAMEPSDLKGVTVVAVIIAVGIALACTVTSAAGAGLRAGRRSLAGRGSTA